MLLWVSKSNGILTIVFASFGVSKNPLSCLSLTIIDDPQERIKIRLNDVRIFFIDIGLVSNKDSIKFTTKTLHGT
jgi:hypothetical protein